MKRYDFTYEPGQPTGASPLRGFLPGRWWAWSRSEWESPAIAAEAYAKELTGGRWPARVALLDTEGLGYPDAERLLPVALDVLNENLNVKTLVVGDLWFGVPVGWSYQRVVSALSMRGCGDHQAMLALANRHRPLVRRAGVAVVLGVIDRVREAEQAGFEFYVRKAELLCSFYREAYPGTEVCAWLMGSCPREDWTELSIDHCRALVHSIAPVCDSVAVYGERRHNRNLCEVLSEPI